MRICLFLIFVPFWVFSQNVSVLNHALIDEILADYNNLDITQHTSFKPIIFSDTVLSSRVSKIKIKANFLDRFINKNLIDFTDADFNLKINPLFNFSIGRDDVGKTYINSRGLEIKGKIGRDVSFYTSFYENQAIFPIYFENYIWQKNLDEIDFVVPGQGIARVDKQGRIIRDLDFAMANGHVLYQVNNYFNFQFGHGKHFIGDGYRSLFLSDNSFNYPYFKITTKVSKFSYTNLFSSYQDLRSEYKLAGIYRKKFSTIHHLSYNINEKLNIGFFEAIIWEQDTFGRGFDVNYLNPIIFYRPVEFALGSEGGNALMGVSFKYNVKNRSNIYSQFLIDEFKLSEIKSGNGWWANKYAVQLGFKSYSFLGIDKLFVQSEFNLAKPFIYSHHRPLQSYSHYGQELAHPFGSSFIENINILRYNYKRYYVQLKFLYAKKGGEIVDSTTNFGSNIFQSYESGDRFEYNNKIAQGNTTCLKYLDLRFGFLLNPINNMKIEIGFSKRQENSIFEESNLNNHYYISLITDLRNIYDDF